MSYDHVPLSRRDLPPLRCRASCLAGKVPDWSKRAKLLLKKLHRLLLLGDSDVPGPILTR